MMPDPRKHKLVAAGVPPVGLAYTEERLPASAHAYLKEAKMDVHTGEDLLFFGPPGVGKSGLAIVLAMAEADRGRTLRYISAPSALDDLSAAFSSGISPTKLVDEMIPRGAFVILDDLGHEERATDATRRAVFQLLDAAYNREAQVVLITNENPASFGKRYGEAAASRMSSYVQYPFKGKDVRPRGLVRK